MPRDQIKDLVDSDCAAAHSERFGCSGNHDEAGDDDMRERGREKERYRIIRDEYERM